MSINTKNVALFGAGFAIGGAAGYFFGYKQAAKKYEALIDAEIESVKKVYGPISSALVKGPIEEYNEMLPSDNDINAELEDIATSKATYNDAIKDLEYGTPLRSETEIKNIFDQPEPDEEDLGEEIVPLSNKRPYQIDLDEYMADYENYEKVSMVYYEEDDTLTDDQESILTDVDSIVGTEFLHKFGGDVQYIRNDRLELDIEVTHHQGSYTTVVMGIHSDDEPRAKPRRPKKSQRDE